MQSKSSNENEELQLGRHMSLIKRSCICGNCVLEFLRCQLAVVYPICQQVVKDGLESSQFDSFGIVGEVGRPPHKGNSISDWCFLEPLQVIESCTFPGSFLCKMWLVFHVNNEDENTYLEMHVASHLSESAGCLFWLYTALQPLPHWVSMFPSSLL